MKCALSDPKTLANIILALLSVASALGYHPGISNEQVQTAVAVIATIFNTGAHAQNAVGG